MDMKKIKAEEKQYVKIPKVYTFGSIAEREAFLAANYNKIIQDIDLLIQEEAPELMPSQKRTLMVSNSSAIYPVNLIFGLFD